MPDLMDIFNVAEKAVSLPILVWIWAMVRNLKESNKAGHRAIHHRMDRFPCQDGTNPGVPCPEER